MIKVLTATAIRAHHAYAFPPLPGSTVIATPPNPEPRRLPLRALAEIAHREMAPEISGILNELRQTGGRHAD